MVDLPRTTDDQIILIALHRLALDEECLAEGSPDGSSSYTAHVRLAQRANQLYAERSMRQEADCG